MGSDAAEGEGGAVTEGNDHSMGVSGERESTDDEALNKGCGEKDEEGRRQRRETDEAESTNGRTGDERPGP